MSLALRAHDAETDMFEAALEELNGYGPELSNGFTSHAPMVAEALDVLGQTDMIRPWIAANRATFLPWPHPTGEPPELGRSDQASDWLAVFRAEIAAQGWRTVLARWVPRLAPGVIAAALHGLIRVGHAARALDRAETPARERELAAALASWAYSYSELPSAAAAGRPNADPGRALSLVPLLPHGRRRHDGAITTAVAELAGFAPFGPVIHLLRIDDAEQAAVAIADLFARVFLGNARMGLGAIVFAHAVTGPAAVLHLLPYVPIAQRPPLVRCVWQAVCALYATYAQQGPEQAVNFVLPSAELGARAAAHGDDHVIKLTEACIALKLDPRLTTAVSLRAMALL